MIDKYAAQKRWNAKNKDKMASYAQKYYLKNRDKLKAYMRSWHLAHLPKRTCSWEGCTVDITGTGKKYCEVHRKESYRQAHLKAQKAYLKRRVK